MVMQLEKVVPFGRSLDEYVSMFSLSAEDLSRSIIGVGDGPASFNAEMCALQRRIVSVDPLYALPAGQIEQRFGAVIDDIIMQIKATPGDWVWSWHRSAEYLRQHRLEVFQRFIKDYDNGRADGRYVAGELPALPFDNGQFELGLCSHFLFLYSAQLSYEFHLAAILEMLRVAQEVRIFPLLTLMLEKSAYIAPLLAELPGRGYLLTIEKVAYELQKGGNEMLCIRKQPAISD